MPYKDPEKRRIREKERYYEKRNNPLLWASIQEKRKEDRNRYKESIKKYDKQYRKNHPWIRVYYHISDRCNNPKSLSYDMYGAKGIRNLLTLEEVEYLWKRDKAYTLKQPSINRKNSTKDYTIDNCEFIELIKNISETWFSSETGKESRQKQIMEELSNK